MLDDDWHLPETEDWRVEDTATAGRGVFARANLTAGSHFLSTSPNLSPIAHVILRKYRREVCAACFLYNRGREWKLRKPDLGLAFCSTECLTIWTKAIKEDEVQARRVIEAHLQRQNKTPRGEENDVTAKSEDDTCTWEEAAEQGNRIVEARGRARPTKIDKRLVQSHIQEAVDPDIVHFLLSGSLARRDGSVNGSLLAIADNPNVYKTASRVDHIRAYLYLLAVLPLPRLPLVQADYCHELISRASHNAFSIRPISDGEQSGEFLGFGVWPEASFFNHSCQPNVRKERAGRCWRFWIDAGVSEGEELCITYLGGEEKELDVDQRRRRLHDEWGFTCTCKRCLTESHEAVDG